VEPGLEARRDGGVEVSVTLTPAEVTPVRVHDKARILEFLERDADLHLYEIGDLDPLFWPHTRWYGLEDGAGRLVALALLYSATALPVLLALSRDGGRTATLLDAIRPQLPARFYAHLSPGLVGVLEPYSICTSHGVRRVHDRAACVITAPSSRALAPGPPRGAPVARA
jgi:hypothetical protein